MKFLAFIGTMVVGLLLSFYVSFIIGKVINWYNIPIVLSFKAIYGITQVFGVFLFYSSKLGKEKELDFTKSLIDIVSKALVLSVLLGIFYLISLIL